MAVIRTGNNTFDTKVICGILRDLRIKGARMTIQELSAKTGIDADYIFHLEREQDTEVKLSTLITILDAMGYDLFITPQNPKPLRSHKAHKAIKPAAKAESKKVINGKSKIRKKS